MSIVFVLAILGGFLLMMAGAYALVWGASGVAANFGVPEMVIGATVVALGTSLPELLTVIVASAQKKDAIGLGNVIGSNIVNVVAILGLAAVILPLRVDPVNKTTLVAFVAASSYLLYCVLMRNTLTRWDGMILLAGFILYTYLNFALKPDPTALPVTAASDVITPAHHAAAEPADDPPA